MTVNSGVSGKGWHNENLRHSQAKRFGKASGGIISAPKSVRSNSKTKKLKSNVKTFTYKDPEHKYEYDKWGKPYRKKKTKVKKSVWREIDEASWKKKRSIDEETIDNMRTFGVDYDERVSKKLEHFEDKYGVDLTHFYGEDYTNKSTRDKLKRKLKLGHD